jgi:hypothetical protein
MVFSAVSAQLLRPLRPVFVFSFFDLPTKEKA